MLGIVIASLIFLTVFLGIFALNLVLTDLFQTDRTEQLKQLEAQLREQMRAHARNVTQQSDLSAISVLASEANRVSIVDLIKRFRSAVSQAGLKTDPQLIGFFGLVGGAAVGVVLYFVTSSILLAGLTMLLGAVFPFVYILGKRQQRMDLLADQLPDALELMSRVLRAGQTITQAMNGVADEFKDPVGTEFGFCYEQQNLGLSLEVAMRNLVERTGVIEIKILVLGIMIQRQAGGNLAELLDKLSGVMRQRNTLKGSVRALTAEGRMQAAFLIALPFVAWIAMYFLNRNYALKLLEHPPLIYSTLGMMVVGVLWIRKIVNFDF